MVRTTTINDALAVTATTVDASAASGKVSVSVGNSNDKAAVAGVDVTDQVIKGGSGNDTIVTAGDDALGVTIEAGAGDDKIHSTAMPVKATLTKNADKIDGGEGNDTLILTKTLAQAAAKANNVTISNIETVQISDGSDGATTLLNIQSGLAQITYAATSGGAYSTVFAAGTGNLVTKGASMGHAYTASDTGTATDDALTLAVTKAASVDAGNNNALVFNGLETVTIDTTTKTVTEQDYSTITMTADTGGTDTLKVVGTSTFHASGAITAEVIDFSGMDVSSHAATTTVANMAAAAVGVTTINGSDGKDILVGDAKSTINGNGGNDTITGGAGNDTLNGGAGNDSITLNAGNDTVDGGDGNDTIITGGNLTTADKLAGGAGTDTLSVTNADLVAIQGQTISEANTFNTTFTGIEKGARS